MFNDIPGEIRERMRYLEMLDAEDRVDGSAKSERLRQVPPDSGRFLALMAVYAPPGSILEIGTSAGYSTMWLALACRLLGRRINTFELSKEKIDKARQTFELTGLTGNVELIARDAREVLNDYRDVAFCFLDAEKEMYAECYEAVVPNLVPGGILLADNVISHGRELQALVDRAEEDIRVDAVTVPIGTGILFCRKV